MEKDRDEKLQTPKEVYEFWDSELRLAKTTHEKYWSTCEDVLKMYKDDRTKATQSKKRSNYYWACIETVKPSVYSSVPEVICKRRNNDRDKIKRLSAEIWERATKDSVENHQDSFYVHTKCSEDYLVLGRGILWERYEGQIETVTDRVAVTDQDMQTGTIAELNQPLDQNEIQQDEKGYFINYTHDRPVGEKVITDYVHYKDFMCNDARTEAEIRWKARRHFMRRDELIKQFGEKIGKEVKREKSPDGVKDLDKGEKTAKRYSTAEVWEVWSLPEKQVIFISSGYADGPLKTEDDPYKLKGFFPTAYALLGFTTSDSVIPVPELKMVQDQVALINDLTDRRDALITALKVNGIYPAEMGDALQGLMDAENRLIPVPNWPAMQGQGGIEAIQWLPIEQIISVLTQLTQAVQFEKEQFYELTGYSDLQRGASDPRETATAQELKYQYGGVRLKQRQRSFQKYLRDTYRIKADIIANKFDPASLIEVAEVNGMTDQAQPQELQAAIELLKAEAKRCYTIDVETDSTLAADEYREREAMTEFMGAVTPFLQNGLAFLQAAPAMIPAMNELFMMVLRRYKSGRSVEGAFETGLQNWIQAQQQAQQQPPPPDPIMQQLQMQNQVEQMKAQSNVEIKQAENQTRLQELQVKGQQEQQAQQIEMQKAMEQFKLDQQKLYSDVELKKQDLALKQKDLEQTFWLELQKLKIELGNREEDTLAAANKPPEAPKPPSQPLHLNVNMPKSGAKVGRIEMLPDGSKQIVMQDINENS